MKDVMPRRRALALLSVNALAPLIATVKTMTVTTTPQTAARGEALHYLSLEDVAGRIKARDLSPVSLTQHMLDRIATADARLKSYATVMRDQALVDARSAEQEIQRGRYRGPLHGVPIAVKDLCYTKGVRTMGGTAVLRTFAPDVDGTVVSKLKNAGAVLLGKLNLTEGAMIGYNPAFDVPLNPWNRDRWPGGSSSGSGVAAAAGLCFGAIGTDTGGSIRFPSSACGVVGLKPTYGRVSRFGVLALAESLDHVGPIARRVSDVALMFDAIAGHDPKDATSLQEPVTPTVADLSKGVDGLRIGIDRDYALKGIDGGQAATIEEALKILEQRGARIVEVKMPNLNGIVNVWFALCGSEVIQAHAANYPIHADQYGPYFRAVLDSGAAVTPNQLDDARRVRAALTTQLNALLESVDAMACPAGGDPAWPITHELQVGPLPAFHAAWSAASPRAAEFTMPMDLAGTPGICLPSGFSKDGLPYSIQFAGRRLSEPMLCRIAHAYEQATNWHTRHPTVDEAR
jgi:amidase